MTDTREAIFTRLVAIAGTVPGINAVYRNQAVPDEGKFPAIVILDGDEAKRDMALPMGRFALQPVILEMRPEIFVVLEDLPENVGTVLNGYRLALMKAVLQDATIQSLTGNQPDRLAYEGCATGLSSARDIVGAIMVSFMFAYVVQPSTL